MMHDRIYEELPVVSHEEAVAIFAEADPKRIAETLVALGLHDADPHWVQEQSLRFLSHSDEVVVSAAILAIGHSARMHRTSGGDTIIQALQAVAADSRYTGKVQDTLDDIETFAKE